MFRALIATLLLAAALPFGARADEASDCRLRVLQPKVFHGLDSYTLTWLRAVYAPSADHPATPRLKYAMVLEEIKVGEETARRYRVHKISGIPVDTAQKSFTQQAPEPSPIFILELGKSGDGDKGAPVTARGGRNGELASGQILITRAVELRGELNFGAIQIISFAGQVRLATADFSDHTVSVSPVTQTHVSVLSGAAGSATSVRSGGGLSIDLPASKENKTRGRVTLMVGPDVLHNVRGSTVQPTASGVVEFLFF